LLTRLPDEELEQFILDIYPPAAIVVAAHANESLDASDFDPLPLHQSTDSYALAEAAKEIGHFLTEGGDVDLAPNKTDQNSQLPTTHMTQQDRNDLAALFRSS
jgi:hypothetical protein